jgi:hypothetical protein
MRHQSPFTSFFAGNVVLHSPFPTLNENFFSGVGVEQGRQIFLDTIHIPKRGKIFQIISKLSNYHKMYQMATMHIFQMGIKYSNVFNSKALQNLPKL